MSKRYPVDQHFTSLKGSSRVFGVTKIDADGSADFVVFDNGVLLDVGGIKEDGTEDRSLNFYISTDKTTNVRNIANIDGASGGDPIVLLTVHGGNADL